MKLLTAAQIREWDRLTIEREPITSLDLMERAASRATEWITACYDPETPVKILCGPGNNGGDGLVIARLLKEEGYEVEVFLLTNDSKSPDFQANLKRWEGGTTSLTEAVFSKADLVIDALLGSGTDRALEGALAEVAQKLNVSGEEVIAIDVPTGLVCDGLQPQGPIVKATTTLTFGAPKWSFGLPSAIQFVGELQVLDIGLDGAAYDAFETDGHWLDREELVARAGEWIESRLLHRPLASHKGTHGHGLLIAGSQGKMGAAVLSATAAMRSGLGLLTVHVPHGERGAIHAGLPEAMVSLDSGEGLWSHLPDLEPYRAVAVGPGIGTDAWTGEAFDLLLESWNGPLVVDADALNLLAQKPERIDRLPKGSILTPHPGEFTRLAGEARDDLHRLHQLRELAERTQSIVVLKGHRTAICAPDGTLFVNTTGNPGMATAGSGDVLTGILLGLITQGIPPLEAALIGVHCHGLSGDIQAQKTGQAGLIASDLTRLSEVWLALGA